MKRVRDWGNWVALIALAVTCGVRPAPVPDVIPPQFGRHGVLSDVTTIDWRLLRTLNFQTGAVSDTLKALNGKRVRLPGFIVPLEDFQERAKEFLLVPYYGACVHLPPPPPNQMVYTSMRADTKLSWWEPVWIEGTLRIIRMKSPYGVASYRIDAVSMSRYEEPGR